MEENRINRRSRPRPYDLRRKVLLKNFLREQMTFIPGTQIGSFSSNDGNNNDNEPAISLNLDEDLPELNDENVSSVASAEQQCSSFSANDADSDPVVAEIKDISEENSKNSSVVTESRDSNPSSLNKITSLMKLRSGSKKKQKGIVKAKDAVNGVKSPTKSKPFRRGLERVFSRKKSYESSSQGTKSRGSPRLLFSLFKNRRAQRNDGDTNRTKTSPYENQKSFGYRSKHTPNQSVQADDSWLRQALLKEQQSNRLLREENRILSESLSYFMSGSSMESQSNHSTLQSPGKHTYNNNVYHDYYPPLSNTSNGWNPRSRVVRSKSVQEHNERKTLLRNNYRTRSMNCHNIRNKVLLPDPKPPTPMYSSQFEEYNPRVRRKTILANLPVNSAVRGIQRRSSMPERLLSENDRTLVCRRAGSFRDAYNRKPFHSLPSEAFY